MDPIAKDTSFKRDTKTLYNVLDPPKITGRSHEITDGFQIWEVEPVLAKDPDRKTLDQEDLRV